MSTADGIGVTFTETDSTDFSSFNILGDSVDRRLDINLGIRPSRFPDVNENLILQHLEAVIDTLPNIGWAVVGSQWVEGESPFDAKRHTVFIFGIFGKVKIQKLERVCIWWAVEIATIPEVGSAFECGFHSFYGLFG